MLKEHSNRIPKHFPLLLVGLYEEDENRLDHLPPKDLPSPDTSCPSSTHQTCLWGLCLSLILEERHYEEWTKHMCRICMT